MESRQGICGTSQIRGELGSIWEAPGRHLEASGGHLGGIHLRFSPLVWRKARERLWSCLFFCSFVCLFVVVALVGTLRHTLRTLWAPLGTAWAPLATPWAPFGHPWTPQLLL